MMNPVALCLINGVYKVQSLDARDDVSLGAGCWNCSGKKYALNVPRHVCDTDTKDDVIGIYDVSKLENIDTMVGDAIVHNMRTFALDPPHV